MVLPVRSQAAGAAGAAGGEIRRRYYLFDNQMVVSEDDVLFSPAGGGAANLVRREFMRVEDGAGPSFKIVYKSGVADAVKCECQQDKKGWLKELHMAGVRRAGVDAIWARYDKDRDGFITREELRLALRSECQISSTDTADSIFRQLDRDGDGRIEKEEFANALIVHGGLRKAPSFSLRSVMPAMPTCSFKTVCCGCVVGWLALCLLWLYVFFSIAKGIFSVASEGGDFVEL